MAAASCIIVVGLSGCARHPPAPSSVVRSAAASPQGSTPQAPDQSGAPRASAEQPTARGATSAAPPPAAGAPTLIPAGEGLPAVELRRWQERRAEPVAQDVTVIPVVVPPSATPVQAHVRLEQLTCYVDATAPGGRATNRQTKVVRLLSTDPRVPYEWWYVAKASMARFRLVIGDSNSFSAH